MTARKIQELAASVRGARSAGATVLVEKREEELRQALAIARRQLAKWIGKTQADMAAGWLAQDTEAMEAEKAGPAQAAFSRAIREAEQILNG